MGLLIQPLVIYKVFEKLFKIMVFLNLERFISFYAVTIILSQRANFAVIHYMNSIPSSSSGLNTYTVFAFGRRIVLYHPFSMMINANPPSGSGSTTRLYHLLIESR